MMVLLRILYVLFDIYDFFKRFSSNFITNFDTEHNKMLIDVLLMLIYEANYLKMIK